MIPIIRTSKHFWKYIKSLRKDHVEVPTLINNGKVITDSLEKAEALNNKFYSVFTDKHLLTSLNWTNWSIQWCLRFPLVFQVFIAFFLTLILINHLGQTHCQPCNPKTMCRWGITCTSSHIYSQWILELFLMFGCLPILPQSIKEWQG